MLRYLVAYALVAATFLVADLLWLGVVAKDYYQASLAPVLADRVNLGAALAFYLIYVLGIVIFAVHPAVESGSWRTALWLGGCLGFVAYATYDLTNLATLRDWPARLAMVDILWGVFVTALSATVGFLGAAHVEGA